MNVYFQYFNSLTGGLDVPFYRAEEMEYYRRASATFWNKFLKIATMEDYYFFILNKEQVKTFPAFMKAWKTEYSVVAQAQELLYNKRYPARGKSLHWMLIKFDVKPVYPKGKEFDLIKEFVYV